jgi:4-amino-4-deoxychorismate lyase
MKTLNRLDNVLARSEWQGGGIAEGLMCDLTGHVIGGTMSNLFLVRQGRLLTPSLNRCGIRGVMRGLVMDSCAAIGVEVEEADIDRQCLADAEELFLTNALIGLWPVNQLEHRPWEIGPLTRAIAAELYVRGVEENGA